MLVFWDYTLLLSIELFQIWNLSYFKKRCVLANASGLFLVSFHSCYQCLAKGFMRETPFVLTVKFLLLEAIFFSVTFQEPFMVSDISLNA